MNKEKKGVMVISLDTELIWGMLHRKDHHKFEKPVRKVRRILPKLLDLFEKHQTKATFAVVGHLLEADCKKAGCPCKKVSKDLTQGKNIIRQIRDKGHEIGIHSHTHKFFDKISEKEAEEELSNVLKQMKKNSMKPSSAVFPQNRIKHIHLLKKYGIKNYRGKDEWWFDKYPGVLQKMFNLLDYFFAIKPPVYKIKRLKSEPLNIPGSMIYLSMDGFRKFIPLSSRIKKAKKGIDAAANENKVFHLWFHPFNLSNHSGKMLKGLDEILKYANKKVTIKTMKEIGDET